jgi:hypothetical protein
MRFSSDFSAGWGFILAAVAVLLPARMSWAQFGGAPAAPEPVPSHSAGQEYRLIVEGTRLGHPHGGTAWVPPMAFPTRTMAQLAGFTPRPETLDKWGGNLASSAQATGFFYVKQVDGRWWSVDPDGHYYFHQGLDGIRTGSTSNPGFSSQFGDKSRWMDKAHALLVENGIQGAGAWSNIELIRSASQQKEHPIAYTFNLDVMSSYGKSRGGTHAAIGHAGYQGGVIFVFDPGFTSFVDGYVKDKVAAYVKDAALFGYFSDNEMPIARDNLDKYLALPHEEAGYQAAKQWMDEHHASSPNDDLRKEFLGYEVDRYAALVSAAIRKYDPHHMYLGCRFNAEALLAPEAFAAMGKYADVISANYYFVRNAPPDWNSWTPDVSQMEWWEHAANKPIMITEFYAKGADTGLSNQGGGGWLVATQAQRGQYFENFVLALIQSKDVIGWNWFKYQDTDPEADGGGNGPPKEAVNQGIVNANYEVYAPLLNSMREINLNSYGLAEYFDGRR